VKTRPLGRSGLRVSEIALGSWLTLGSSVGRAASRAIVGRAVELGVNLFDTADVYANGAAERALGEALAEAPRQQLVIATKCFFAMSDRPNDRGLSRKHIVESVEGSLRRLDTDYIDLHQCHRFDPDTPVAETVRAYDDLIRQGKLLYWGVSQWSAAQIREACRVADSLNAPRPISNQPGYSILRREIEAEILPTCEAEGLGQIAFSPLAQGVLTGKYGGGRRPGESRALDAQRNRWMESLLRKDPLERVEALRPLSEGLGIAMSQLALAWCLRSRSVTSVIVGATGIEQLEENCRAPQTEVSAELVARIDELFPPPSQVD
jgi:voltage-dependent potassium channel beta subunit